MRAIALSMLLAAGVTEAECPHPYFPMEEGLTLTYRAGNAEVKVRVLETVRDDAAGAVDSKLEVTVKDRTAITMARCDGGGVKTEAGGLEGIALQSSGLDVKILSSDGVAFPALEALGPGKSWKSALRLELRAPGQTSGFQPVVRTSFEKTSTVVGNEAVTVAGGTFEAVKLRNLTKATINGTGGGRTLESDAWVAPGVGLIKISTDGKTDFELVALERPPPPRTVTPSSKKSARASATTAGR